MKGANLNPRSMPQNVVVKSRIQLKDFDPAEDFGLKKEKTREATRRLLERIGGLQAKLYANTRRSVLVVLQGMDASGKDGATKSLLEFVNPAGVEVTDFKAPSSEELAHDFLWRVHHAVPRYGRIGVFNRSHYEDVLVVRVMKLAPKEIWAPRFEQINRFELNLHEAGYTLLKFYLHISREEQAERLRARIQDPAKNWKFEGADLRMRERWDEFMTAYEEAINQCSPKHARWHIIPADKKWVRDHVIAKHVCAAMEELELSWPKPREDLSKYTVH
jgi:PPK2 family polyphosphate:nucleotide phosphotransferase